MTYNLIGEYKKRARWNVTNIDTETRKFATKHRIYKVDLQTDIKKIEQLTNKEPKNADAKFYKSFFKIQFSCSIFFPYFCVAVVFFFQGLFTPL